MSGLREFAKGIAGMATDTQKVNVVHKMTPEFKVRGWANSHKTRTTVLESPGIPVPVLRLF